MQAAAGMAVQKKIDISTRQTTVDQNTARRDALKHQQLSARARSDTAESYRLQGQIDLLEDYVREDMMSL